MGMPLWIRNPAKAFFSLLLAMGTMLIGIGLGERLLDLLKLSTATDGERILLASGLGLGALSYRFLTLGLIGLLRPWAIGAVIVLAIVGAWSSLKHRLARWKENRAKGSTIALHARLTLQLGFFERLGITLTGVMLLIVLIRGLGPVTDYDGLAYHLVMPRNVADVILSVGALHHMTPLDEVMVSLNRIARSVAFLVAIEPQNSNPFIQTVRWIREIIDPSYSQEQIFFSTDELKNLFTRHGITELEIDFQGFLTPPFAQVIIPPQFLTAPLVRLAIGIDKWLHAHLPTGLRRLSFNVVVIGRFTE
jgi:SAM-dependent methyltransferase